MSTQSCERCRKPAFGTTMSRFNRDIICMECEDAERLLPEYAEAHAAEEAAVRRGDYNFPGIGLPRKKK